MHLRKAAEDVSVLKMRCSINADTMTKAELHQNLSKKFCMMLTGLCLKLCA